MDRPRPWRWAGAALATLLLYGMPSTVGAQTRDPAAAIDAYAAALNAHDLAAGLELFDQYGSATDGQGRHFEGRDGLTEFLLASGFGATATHISIERIHVVANRAQWSYRCTCATVSTEVRLVLNRDKISVFAVIPPATSPASAPPVPVPGSVFRATATTSGQPPEESSVLRWPVTDTGELRWPLANGALSGWLAWLVGLGLAAAAVTVRAVLRDRRLTRHRSTAERAQGQLLAALLAGVNEADRAKR